MIRASVAHPLCAILITVLASPTGFAQTSPAPVAPVPSATVSAAAPTSGTPLSITILEGNNVVNSIPLLHSVAVAVEVRDSNDFPVENVSITFTLPAEGPGGTFARNGKTFTTRSDLRGQAIAPPIVPTGVGKFQIVVKASAGDRKGETVVNQTNSDQSYVGPVLPARPWYKRKLVWAGAGAATAVGLVFLLRSGSGNSSASAPTIVITPGAPVFR